ncbi:hypothetical protein PPYR_11126 [Photinus pyralis]|uniref:Haemolymph juvenile hormone binding protein n=1 Tax=Photinus pyralis TaxID=7054 RepID=A0A1Y1LU34_PHOPY|nr:uncharacterized protein LOC116176741 [Photinus pyralis]KAB0794287.1 hypothetical protein PPYR_11126 [Photinus pyralis]
MKLFVVVICVVTQFLGAHSKTLPDPLPEPCKRSDKDFRGCVLKSFNKVGVHLSKGIPKYGVPKLDPIEIPLMVVNRTLNEFFSVEAVMKNIKVTGLSSTYVNDFKMDLEKMAGEIKFTIPLTHLEMDFKVVGQLFAIPLKNEGFFRGNFSDTVSHFKGSLKTVVRNGVKYFALDKFKAKSTIADGHIKMTSTNPQDQFAVDIISNFYNENPRRTMDLVNPLYVETLTNFFKVVVEKGLAATPAEDLLPQ